MNSASLLGLGSAYRSMIQILFTSLLFVAAAAGTEVFESKMRQIDWLRSRDGGFVSEKVGVVPPPGHPEGAGGLFALDRIEKGEKIFFIPKDSVLKPYDMDDDDYDLTPNEMMCDTAERLLDEYELGEDSEFWPYVQYVFESFRHWALPYAWSQEGKNLVQNIIGKDLLEPSDFGSFSPCPGPYDGETRVWMDAALRIAISRGWDHILVPVYDMANHHNGKGHNMDQLYDSSDRGDFEVVALRDIERGEQLCLSYNQCNDETCEGYDMIHVTPHLFGEYGFVELFPQRWLFPTFEEDEDLIFEIDQSENKEDSLQVTWLNGEPSEGELRWLDVNHKRLVGMRDFVLYEVEKLEAQHEAQAALEFYEATTRAMELAILHATVGEDIHDCSLASNRSETCSVETTEYSMGSHQNVEQRQVVDAAINES